MKWPGGKRGLLKFIVPQVPKEYGTYYEPFLGGGALFFALQPSKAVLADKNSELISMYRQVQRNPEELIRVLRTLRNSERAYYRIREWRPTTAIEKAARLIYLATLSFNGIHRVNLKGKFNVPYGHKVHVDPCDAAKIRETSRILEGTNLKCQDFERTLQSAEKGDLVYIDPPYTTAHANNGFIKYNSKIFTWDDQRRLANIARELANRGCSVLVSNADHVSIRELYCDFDFTEIKRHSIIAASGSFRRLITECLFYRINTHRQAAEGDCGADSPTNSRVAFTGL